MKMIVDLLRSMNRIWFIRKYMGNPGEHWIDSCHLLIFKAYGIDERCATGTNQCAEVEQFH
jgi:hypothetical protein